MAKGHELAVEIHGYGLAAFMAIIMLVVLYKTAATFVPDLPAAVGTTIMGIVGAYAFATSKRFRKSVLNWSKKK